MVLSHIGITQLLPPDKSGFKLERKIAVINTIFIDGQPNVFDLEYSEMEIDTPQEFPFSIPSHYEKI